MITMSDDPGIAALLFTRARLTLFFRCYVCAVTTGGQALSLAIDDARPLFFVLFAAGMVMAAIAASRISGNQLSILDFMHISGPSGTKAYKKRNRLNRRGAG